MDAKRTEGAAAQRAADASTKVTPTSSPSPLQGGTTGVSLSTLTDIDLSAEALRAQAEKGMADMSAKFAEVGKELYVSESGKKREAID